MSGTDDVQAPHRLAPSERGDASPADRLTTAARAALADDRLVLGAAVVRADSRREHRRRFRKERHVNQRSVADAALDRKARGAFRGALSVSALVLPAHTYDLLVEAAGIELASENVHSKAPRRSASRCRDRRKGANKIPKLADGALKSSASNDTNSMESHCWRS